MAGGRAGLAADPQARYVAVQLQGQCGWCKRRSGHEPCLQGLPEYHCKSGSDKREGSVNPTESFIVTHFNEVVSLIIAAALGWAGKAFYATIQEQKALKKAVKALLHDRLYQSCRYYIQQGYVDSEGLTNVGLVYEAYHELKGNGTGTNLYERMTALPLREDHIA